MVNNRTEFLNKVYHEIPIDKIAIYQPKELLRIIITYLREHNLFMTNIKEIKVVDGVLYFDNLIVKRICEKDTKIYDKNAYLWEGKILNRQEETV